MGTMFTKLKKKELSLSSSNKESSLKSSLTSPLLLTYDQNIGTNHLKLCNEANRNRWRGIKDFRFREYDSGGFLCASTPSITHCTKSIVVCGLRYKDWTQKISIDLPDIIYNKLELDLKSLSMLSTTLYCNDLQDFNDACKSIIKYVPEFDEVQKVVLEVAFLKA